MSATALCRFSTLVGSARVGHSGNSTAAAARTKANPLQDSRSGILPLRIIVILLRKRATGPRPLAPTGTGATPLAKYDALSTSVAAYSAAASGKAATTQASQHSSAVSCSRCRANQATGNHQYRPTTN